MLSKKRRVSRVLFEEVFPKTRIVSTDFFTVRFLKIDKECPTRFSVIVSKKVSLKAVKRNLLKRRISNVLKKIEGAIEDSYIALIFSKKKALEVPFVTLEEELKKSLSQIKILKAE